MSKLEKTLWKTMLGPLFEVIRRLCMEPSELFNVFISIFVTSSQGIFLLGPRNRCPMIALLEIDTLRKKMTSGAINKSVAVSPIMM